MSKNIVDFDYESKQLAIEIKENEAKYISGEWSLNTPLEKTDKLYESAFAAAEKTTASRVLQDSSLIQLQSNIVRKCARSYKPDTLVFDPRSFSMKVKKYFSPVTAIHDDSKSATNKLYASIWQKLGEECKANMHTTPTFNFINGTFDHVPASPVKKKRKRVEKDKIADVTKPETVSVTEQSEGKDPTIFQATRLLSILIKFIQKSEKGALCFYEFVTDPSSFTRTIEHIFTVSLLVQNGHVCIFEDEQGLPCLRHVKEEEQRERKLDPSGRMQSVLSMSVDEWKAIVKKFNFKTAMIPPPRSINKVPKL